MQFEKNSSTAPKRSGSKEDASTGAIEMHDFRKPN
jgi:hypothetical protein